MSVTGIGTVDNPFVVHSYDEFISLSGHAPISGTGAVYIKWFDNPRQVLDCNSYGTEFKWGAFTDNAGLTGTCTYYIDLNGATIKNFLIADGETMFQGHYYSVNGNKGTIVISNGYIRNVFMGSATCKIIGEYVELHDVSISANISGLSSIPFDGVDIGHSSMDNCALYIVSSRLYADVINRIDMTDTDMEFHISDQNGYAIFTSYNGNPMTIKDCRVQGKISGIGYTNQYLSVTTVLGAINSYNQYAEGIARFVNSVIDVDISESQSGSILSANNDSDYGTNVICKSHFPSGMTPPPVWNFMTHEQIRNGSYLNSAGFTVVEIVDGD